MSSLSWILRNSGFAYDWHGVTYGNGLFVAVSQSKVMTSPDGINWTLQSCPDSIWYKVTYGNGLFVAVAVSGTDKVITSPDGITWTARTAAADYRWIGVTYGNGLFVAVGEGGNRDRVMTSPDGINWTLRNAAFSHVWSNVTYGNGLFVAVAPTSSNYNQLDSSQFMTSPDGISWTSRNAPANNTWTSVTYGNGLFVAISVFGQTKVITSTDGITWTPRTATSNINWSIITYGNGLFVAVNQSNVMTSHDGITWTLGTAPNKVWTTLTYGNGLFVALAGTDVMTANVRPPTISNFSVPIKKLGDSPFTINAPTSNSNGSFSYTSSNTSVATISGSTITIVGTGRSIITAAQSATDDYTSGTINANLIVAGELISNICFLGNTPVKVDQGTFAISQLKEGIHSINGNIIKRITATKTNDKNLICIEKHALDMNVPSQKTIITANHKIMYKGKMVKSKDLIGLVDNVYKTKYRGETLYNVLLETHETINVNNMICETLSPENTIVQLYDILDKIPSEYHADIIVQFNNQINDKKLLSHY